MTDIIRIGLDTSKSLFQLHGVDAAEQPVLRKQLRRAEMIRFFEKLPPAVVVLEACGASHHWARLLSSFGHEVKLIAPQLAKPYVKRGKNDAADAEALCEAASRPTMRFVPVKSADQQAALMLVGVRTRLIKRRTQLANYLIDLDHGVIVDVEATTAVRQAEVTAAKRMIERAQGRYGLWPERLAADTGYGSAEMLAWLVHEKGIEPHVPVFDKSARTDGTFSREDFRYYAKQDIYRCPGGTRMRTTGTLVNDGATLIYRASKHDCSSCALRPRCCPKEPQRKVTRSIHEGARDLARDLSKTDAWLISRRERKKVEMLFAHLKRILKLDRLRLRGPCGARDEFHLAAAAQNLRKMAKLIGPKQLAVA